MRKTPPKTAAGTEGCGEIPQCDSPLTVSRDLKLAVFAPGEQSVVFPGAPAGILFPTDPGVPRTLAPPGNHDFAPRVGLAYAPDSKTSLRASFGMFYTAIEALTKLAAQDTV